MDFIEAAIFILFFTIIAVPFASRFRIPVEIFLVLGSAIISLIPGLPNLQVSPRVVFYLFLPPILFYAAYFTSWRDFKAHLRPIVLLAFGLVLCTAFAVAGAAKLLLPNFSWAETFILGAIVSPSDITAASAILRKMGAPRRFVAILEGESLINDATALTLFRFSLVALISGSFSFTDAVGRFSLIACGGMIIGLGVSAIAIVIVQRIKYVEAETTFTFLIAFTSYIIAEHLGVSGVISTVAAGIYFGLRFPEFAATQTRLNAKASWRTLLFIINGFAFTLLGFQLPWVATSLVNYSLGNLVLYGITISFVVIGMRLLWIYVVLYLPQIFLPRSFYKGERLSWQFLFALSLTGMRGIVSLAAVLSLPYQLAPNVPFVHRDLLVFMTYCVIAVTLIPPGITLPYLLQILHLSESENKMKEEALARVLAAKGVLETVDLLAKADKIQAEVVEDFKKQIKRRLNVIKTQLTDNPYSTLTNEFVMLKKLTLSAIESERKTLFELRRNGKIHDEIFHLLVDELDLEEMRANTMRL